jgi:hypothetical protein
VRRLFEELIQPATKIVQHFGEFFSSNKSVPAKEEIGGIFVYIGSKLFSKI